MCVHHFQHVVLRLGHSHTVQFRSFKKEYSLNIKFALFQLLIAQSPLPHKPSDWRLTEERI